MKIKEYLLTILIITSSCAKEIYTDADAANAKREAQKVGLTVMLRDIGGQSKNMSGFAITSSQFGELNETITSVDGFANLMIYKGDVVVNVKKDGYVTATAVVTTNETENERNNTVVIIPVFSELQQSGNINGKLSVKMPSSVEMPLADAVVSIDIDFDELMSLALPVAGENTDKYRPGALIYSSGDIAQQVRTNASGEFQFIIPATVAEIPYVINIHETVVSQNYLCAAKQTVFSNGQNSQLFELQLTTYEKN